MPPDAPDVTGRTVRHGAGLEDAVPSHLAPGATTVSFAGTPGGGIAVSSALAVLVARRRPPAAVAG